RGRILVRDAPDAGELSGPGDDAQLVLPLERGTQRAELPNGFAGRVVIAPLERRLARVRERMRLRDRRGLGRDIDDGLMRGLEPSGQSLDLAQGRPAHRELEDQQRRGDGRDGSERRLAPAIAPHVEHGERAAEAPPRRLVDEALLAQRPYALLENRIADLDALARVDLAQPCLERALAILGAELSLDDSLAMAQRVDDVHRKHQLVERRTLSLGFVAGPRRAHRFVHARIVIVLLRTLRRWNMRSPRRGRVLVKLAAARSRAPGRA